MISLRVNTLNLGPTVPPIGCHRVIMRRLGLTKRVIDAREQLVRRRYRVDNSIKMDRRNNSHVRERLHPRNLHRRRVKKLGHYYRQKSPETGYYVCQLNRQNQNEPD